MTDYLEEEFQFGMRKLALIRSKSFALLCNDKLRNTKPRGTNVYESLLKCKIYKIMRIRQINFDPIIERQENCYNYMHINFTPHPCCQCTINLTIISVRLEVENQDEIMKLKRCRILESLIFIFKIFTFDSL